MDMNLDGVDVAALQGLLTPRLTKYIPYDPTPIRKKVDKQQFVILFLHVIHAILQSKIRT
jgi:hypothetical protein